MKMVQLYCASYILKMGSKGCDSPQNATLDMLYIQNRWEFMLLSLKGIFKMVLVPFLFSFVLAFQLCPSLVLLVRVILCYLVLAFVSMVFKIDRDWFVIKWWCRVEKSCPAKLGQSERCHLSMILRTQWIVIWNFLFIIMTTISSAFSCISRDINMT